MLNQPLSRQAIIGRQAALRDLAEQRKQANWGYLNIAHYQGGAHECDFVSPYTKSACNVASNIFVMLQDWTSDDSANNALDPEEVHLGYTPAFRTNVNLHSLLEKHFKVSRQDIYATNLFPFIKAGHFSAGIPWSVLQRAAKEFGRPQIDLIQARLTIVLGLESYNAIRHTYAAKAVRPMASAISDPLQLDSDSRRIWCQAHPGGLGIANRGGMKYVDKDWETMAAWYFAAPSASAA